MGTYAEMLKGSIRVVEGIDKYPLVIPHFMESLFLVYAHIAKCQYMTGYPAYSIGGEDYAETEGHYPTLGEVTSAIIGTSNPMMATAIGAEFNNFVDWLLGQHVPEDEETIIWGGPMEVVGKFNEWVELSKSPDANP